MTVASKSALHIAVAGDSFMLLAARAVYWPARRWLIIADAHFGKAATFRSLGVPVPHGTTSDGLSRLDTLIDTLQPTATVFLGDLFHAREAHAPATLDALYEWRERHCALELILVEGNHDRRAGPTPAPLRIHTEIDPWRVGSFAFCHYPRFVDSAFAFAGHLHPVVHVYGRADDSVRLACFWMRSGSTDAMDVVDAAGLMVLPAFGGFTGGAVIDRECGDRVIAVAEDRVVELPARRYGSRSDASPVSGCGQKT